MERKKFGLQDRVRVNSFYLESYLDEGGADPNGAIASYVGKEGQVTGSYRYVAVHFDDGDEGFFSERELDLIKRYEG